MDTVQCCICDKQKIYEFVKRKNYWWLDPNRTPQEDHSICGSCRKNGCQRCGVVVIFFFKCKNSCIQSGLCPTCHKKICREKE